MEPRTQRRMDAAPWLIGVGVALVLLLAHGVAGLRGFERVIHDLHFVLRGDDTRPSEHVALVEIDDHAMTGPLSAEMGLGSWPWSREWWALLEQAVLRDPDYRPGLTLYDLVFDLPHDAYREGDYLLDQALRESGNVMLACSVTDITLASRAPDRPVPPAPAGYARFALQDVDATSGDPYRAHGLIMPVTYTLTLGDERGMVDLLNAPMGLGFTVLPRKDAGVVRAFPLVLTYDGQHYPSLPLLACAAYLGATTGDIEVVYGKHVTIQPPVSAPLVIPIDRHGSLLVDFRSGEWRDSFQSVSFIELFEALLARREGAPPPVDPARLKDRIALVGVTASVSTDFHAIPNNAHYPGVAVLAQVLDAMLDGRFLRVAPMWVVSAIVLAMSLAGAWGTRSERVRPLHAFIGVLALAALYAVAVYWLFAGWRVVLPTLTPVLALVFSHSGMVIYRHLLEERQKAQIKSIFGRIVSREVMDELLQSPNALQLGGVKRNVAIVFTDIKGYTAMSERLTPEQVVALLNEYLTDMVDIVLANEGTLDKYIGDAMMLLFGAPKRYARDETFVWLAVRCAVRMQERMRVLQARWREQGHPPMQMRVGVNYGDVVVGLIGSEKRLEFTVIGDNVNLAARLESNAPPDGVLISESVYEMVKERIVADKMPPITVKNKALPVQTYSVKGLVEQQATTTTTRQAEDANA